MKFEGKVELSGEVRKGTGNCGVVATALFCDVDYKKTEDTYREILGNGWGKEDKPGSFGVSVYDIKQVLKKLNKRRSVAFQAGGTLQQFVNEQAIDGVRYLIITTGHAQVLQNGYVTDQAGCKHISEFWGRRKRCKLVFAVK